MFWFVICIMYLDILFVLVLGYASILIFFFNYLYLEYIMSFLKHFSLKPLKTT